MVQLIVGTKGTGKTKKMIDLANETVTSSKGSIVFINKNQRLMYDLKHDIRVVCMEDYPEIDNSDEYIGFLHGILSGDHDIEYIFIDSILKHAEINVEHVPEFLNRIMNIAEKYGPKFVVSLSADLSDLKDIVTDIDHYKILN